MCFKKNVSKCYFLQENKYILSKFQPFYVSFIKFGWNVSDYSHSHHLTSYFMTLPTLLLFSLII